ncbi:WhiB family transcriptional regulator [Kineococcus terrestris]|uniref:WhiB family transcriptional regulator n=1 Tax=Kineococcus terrestris TaxID=2044856 RepID=UPI0034DAC1D7
MTQHRHPAARPAARPDDRPKEVSGVQRRHQAHPTARPTAQRQRPQAPACRRYDAELWFAEKPEDVELAKELCAGCPLAAACLAGALERAEPWGVWGGQLVLAGVVVPRKRPRGRPRKHPVAA